MAIPQWSAGEPLEARQPGAGAHAAAGAAAAAAAAAAKSTTAAAALRGAGETEPEPKPPRRWVLDGCSPPDFENLWCRLYSFSCQHLASIICFLWFCSTWVLLGMYGAKTLDG